MKSDFARGFWIGLGVGVALLALSVVAKKV
jgi:hypothetical protein